MCAEPFEGVLQMNASLADPVATAPGTDLISMAHSHDPVATPGTDLISVAHSHDPVATAPGTDLTAQCRVEINGRGRAGNAFVDLCSHLDPFGRGVGRRL